jgi:hypothetical protein
VGPTAGLDDLEKRKFLTPPGLKLQPLGHPAHSQLLSRLLYYFSTEHFPGKTKEDHENDSLDSRSLGDFKTGTIQHEAGVLITVAFSFHCYG